MRSKGCQIKRPSHDKCWPACFGKLKLVRVCVCERHSNMLANRWRQIECLFSPTFPRLVVVLFTQRNICLCCEGRFTECSFATRYTSLHCFFLIPPLGCESSNILKSWIGLPNYSNRQLINRSCSLFIAKLSCLSCICNIKQLSDNCLSTSHNYPGTPYLGSTSASLSSLVSKQQLVVEPTPYPALEIASSV